MEQGTDENFEEAYLKLGIEVIDMKKEVFDVHPDPLSLYPGRVNGHFNGEAKRLMAKVIAKHLEDDEALLGNR